MQPQCVPLRYELRFHVLCHQNKFTRRNKHASLRNSLFACNTHMGSLDKSLCTHFLLLSLPLLRTASVKMNRLPYNMHPVSITSVIKKK